MENSFDTIELFNEVMDYFDSLSDKEFSKKMLLAENREITHLLMDAGYFNKWG